MKDNLKMIIRFLAVLFITLTMTGTVFGAHPLVTDDTGTLGSGKFQIEVTSEINYEKESTYNEDRGGYVTAKETGGEVTTTISYGLDDNIDIVIGLPYQWKKIKEDGITTSDADGVSDMSLEVKWRFYENDSFSLALKPGITLPTGDEEKGLGNGKASYSTIFIVTKKIGPWAFHFNLGYTYNKYKLQADKDANRNGIWHVSIASEVDVIKDLRAVANIGIEKNPDKTSKTNPAFILGVSYIQSQRILI